MASALCEAERPQASSLYAPSRPMGRLLDLFIMLASLIWPWGRRVGCWGVVGCLQEGLSHPRPSLPKMAL
eukprot:1161696-Pelagomonas_calceolata.AAC.38